MRQTNEETIGLINQDLNYNLSQAKFAFNAFYMYEKPFIFSLLFFSSVLIATLCNINFNANL